MVDPSSAATMTTYDLTTANTRLPDSEQDRLIWTQNLVNKVDEKYQLALQAEDYQQLSIDMALTDDKKVCENFLCPICTLVIEDIV